MLNKLVTSRQYKPQESANPKMGNQLLFCFPTACFHQGPLRPRLTLLHSAKAELAEMQAMGAAACCQWCLRTLVQAVEGPQGFGFLTECQLGGLGDRRNTRAGRLQHDPSQCSAKGLVTHCCPTLPFIDWKRAVCACSSLSKCFSNGKWELKPAVSGTKTTFKAVMCVMTMYLIMRHIAKRKSSTGHIQ